jgi:replication-associated recombination protein RarA
MWSETKRPEFLDDVVGHAEVKSILTSYLKTPPYSKAVLLHGPPGIGKTSIALASIRTCGMEPIELNATQLRSHEDVARLMSSYRNTRTISSLLRGDTKTSCLVLDEIDGSDSHAQRKLSEWICGDRTLPILMTCNEVPRIFRMDRIHIVRCHPPRVEDLEPLFKQDVRAIAIECQHDVRRMLNRLQYGVSSPLPQAGTLAKHGPEVTEILRQKMWVEIDPLMSGSAEYRGDTPGTAHSSETNSGCTEYEKDANT